MIERGDWSPHMPSVSPHTYHKLPSYHKLPFLHCCHVYTKGFHDWREKNCSGIPLILPHPISHYFFSMVVSKMVSELQAPHLNEAGPTQLEAIQSIIANRVALLIQWKQSLMHRNCFSVPCLGSHKIWSLDNIKTQKVMQRSLSGEGPREGNEGTFSLVLEPHKALTHVCFLKNIQ